MKLVLASQSPRRRDLLALTGFSFTAQPTDTDETQRPGEGARDYARRLSVEKAQAAAQAVEGNAVIVAADTIVVDGDQVLGKPVDADEARRTLRTLRGRVHEVCTAVTILETGRGQSRTTLASSPVRMRDYSDQEIEAYIASGDPFDKAGAYAIQHAGFHPVEGFEHCFANVMGLPLCHLTRVLREMGIEPPEDVPGGCQAALDYECPVFQRILNGEE